jgi:hypothetical protein
MSPLTIWQHVRRLRAELASQTASRDCGHGWLNPVYRPVLERVSHHALFKTDKIIQHLTGRTLRKT